jgi:hypothetical protein
LSSSSSDEFEVDTASGFVFKPRNISLNFIWLEMVLLLGAGTAQADALSGLRGELFFFPFDLDFATIK